MAGLPRPGVLFVLCALSLTAPAPGAAIAKETLKIDRDSRTYYLFVPDSVGSEPTPLVITFHGSGRDGRPLVDLFRGLAAKECFIVAGPDAIDRRNVIPIAIARQARDPLVESGFAVEFHALPGYEHNTIYSRGDSVVQPAWEFLKTKALEGEPRYQVYSYQQR